MVATTPSRPCPVGRRSWGGGEAVATSVRVSRSQSVGVRDTETGGSTLSSAWGPCPGSWRTGGEHRLPQEVGEPGRGRKGRPAWPLGVKPPFSGVCRAQTGLRGPAADGLLHCRPLRLGHHRAGGVCFSVNGSVCRSVPKSAHEVLRLGKGRSEEHVLLQGGAGGLAGVHCWPQAPRPAGPRRAGQEARAWPAWRCRPHGGAGLRPRSHRGPGAAAAVCGRQSRRATRGRLAVALQVTVTEQRLGAGLARRHAWAGRGREAAAHSPRRSWRVSRGRGGWSCCSGTRPWFCA